MNTTLATRNEAPYLGGSATHVPAYEETIWFCPDCLVNGEANKLLHVAETKALACPFCPAEFPDDADLALAYFERIGELMGEKAHAEKQVGLVRAKLTEAMEISA